MAYVQKMENSFLLLLQTFKKTPTSLDTLVLEPSVWTYPPRSYSLIWSIWGRVTGLDRVCFFGLAVLNRVYNLFALVAGIL